MNYASLAIMPKEDQLQSKFFAPLNYPYPNEYMFSPESRLLLCYDGQESTDCSIQNLDIIFDARGGSHAAPGVIFGKDRIFKFLSFIK